MVNGVLYFTAGQRRNVVAAKPDTGETLWMWRPDEGERFDRAPRKVHRGVAYWTDGRGDERIVVVDARLPAGGARTRRPGSRSRASAQTASSICSSSWTTTCKLDPLGKIGNSSPPVVSATSSSSARR